MSGLRSIGAVVDDLSEEFPDITASKVRYLESEGLIEPQRTPRGSRRYSQHDIDTLRRILRLQRDEFLPLAVIRERLGEPEPQSGGSMASGGVPTSRMRPPRGRTMTASEVAQRAGIDAATLRELTASGLVLELDSGAVEVCRAVARLREYGIEPRHLRSFRAAADREIGLAAQALAPHRGNAPAVEVRERAAELLALLLDLHVAMVRQRSSTLEA
jgi:DNA-binding transcriptional MerR regulator